MGGGGETEDGTIYVFERTWKDLVCIRNAVQCLTDCYQIWFVMGLGSFKDFLSKNGWTYCFDVLFLKTILLVGLLLECTGLARKIDTTKQSRHITRILLLRWKLASKRTEISTRRCPQESHSRHWHLSHYISALLVTATCLRLVLAMRQCALRQAMFQKFRSRSLVNAHGSVESLHIHYIQ